VSPLHMEGNERRKPLSFDPSTGSYLYIDDIAQGRVFLPGRLDDSAKKDLVIKRLEMSEPFSIESLQAADLQQQIREIREDTPLGRDIVSAEINNLAELIQDIQRGDIV
jgi:hypothetical protein